MFPAWETGKHWENMRAPLMFLGKCFLVLLSFNETEQPEFSPKQQDALKNFACKGGPFLRGNLLACKQGLRKLQIPFSVHPRTDSLEAK